MTKSVGNCISLDHFLENHSVNILKLIILNNYYSQNVSYSEMLNKINWAYTFLNKLKYILNLDIQQSSKINNKFEELIYLLDNYNTPQFFISFEKNLDQCIETQLDIMHYKSYTNVIIKLFGLII